MGIEFKLSDRELPASPAFIRFLDELLSGSGAGHEVWPDQLSEQLAPRRMEDQRRAAEAAERVMSATTGREAVARAYGLLAALLTGDTAALAPFHERFRFVNIVGVPRTGGSYLTAELFRALGRDPHRVPGALAHDSFPEAGPFELTRGYNSWIGTLKTTAEYLVMVELFFLDKSPQPVPTVVPKKLTQGVYAAGLFQSVFGPQSEYILTVRHPAAACVSTYEKSGGLPEDGCFRVRSNIEHWCRRDLEHCGWTADRLATMDYFDAYLRYWEDYHLLLATTGLSCSSQLRVVAYGAANMQSLAQEHHDSFGSGWRAADFTVSDRARQQHPAWVERALPTLERVRAAWQGLGLVFPFDEVARCL